MVTVSRMSGGAAGAAAPAGVRAAGHGHVSTAVGVGLGVISSQAGAGMTSMVGCLGCAPHSPAQWDGERATSVGLRENSGQARSRRFGNDAAPGLGTAFPHCRSRNAGAPGRVIGSPARGVPGPECPPGVRLSGRMRQEDFRSAADVHDRWVVDVDRVELSFGSPLEQGLAFGVCCVEGLDGAAVVLLRELPGRAVDGERERVVHGSFLSGGRQIPSACPPARLGAGTPCRAWAPVSDRSLWAGRASNTVCPPHLSRGMCAHRRGGCLLRGGAPGQAGPLGPAEPGVGVIEASGLGAVAPGVGRAGNHGLQGTLLARGWAGLLTQHGTGGARLQPCPGDVSRKGRGAVIEHVRAVWALGGLTMGRRLCLAYLATLADERGRCRIQPAQAGRAVGMAESRVDGELAAMTREGLIDSRYWDDSGAWSVTLKIGDAS